MYLNFPNLGMQLGNKSIHLEREVILEDKVKMKLPQKIKLDFSSKLLAEVTMALV